MIPDQHLHLRAIVREDLGDDLTSPASDDETQLTFSVAPGDTATTIARRLEHEGFLRDSRAFVYEATARDLTSQLQTGEFILRKSQTPDELVTALLDPGKTPYVDIAIRSQLRLEQVTALLLKLKAEQGLEMDVQEFYDLATDPPSTLLEDYPWLRNVLAGAPGGIDPTLEGFLWPSTYRVLPDTSAEELIRRHAIARQSGLTTVDQEHVTMLTVQTEIGQKHVLVITFQKHPFDPFEFS